MWCPLLSAVVLNVHIGHANCAVDMIENPPVNPITGAHRSGDTVRVELQAYQAQLRLASPDTPPIFESEYIFFTVRGKGIKLGRIMKAPHGGALHPEDTFDVTEYEHIPHPDVHGFFGTFKPLANPNHAAGTRGSRAYVHHRDVKREDAVVCNVTVFAPVGRRSTDLRVTLESLRRLADAMPDLHSLPQRIPNTHAQQSSQGSHSPLRLTVSDDASVANRPLVKPGDRVQVYWDEEPEGWFAGTVTSNRREDNTWVSRIMYDACDEWGAHAAWHILDPAHDDHVSWRFEP